jgi:hypothetical protein
MVARLSVVNGWDGGQVVGGEQGLDVHVHRAGDVAFGIVFGGAEADDVGVVFGVAVVEVFEQVGGLDGLGTLTEVGISRSGCSNYLDSNWGH